jgi:hypothetical protein
MTICYEILNSLTLFITLNLGKILSQARKILMFEKYFQFITSCFSIYLEITKYNSEILRSEILI